MTHHPARHRIATIGISALLLLLWAAWPASASITNIYWTGNAGDGSWANTANWDLGRLPTSNDIVRLGYALDGNDQAISNIVQNIDLDISGVDVYRLVIETTDDRAVNLSSSTSDKLNLWQTGAVGTPVPVHMTANATAHAVLNVTLDMTVKSDSDKPQVRNDSPNAVLTVSGQFNAGTSKDSFRTGIGTVRLHSLGSTQNLDLGRAGDVGVGTTIFDGISGRVLTTSFNNAIHLAGDMSFWRYHINSATGTLSIIESGAADRTVTFTYAIGGNTAGRMQIVPNTDASTGSVIIRQRESGGEVFALNSAEIITIPGSRVEFFTTAGTQTNAQFRWANNAGISGGGDVLFNRTAGGVNNRLTLMRALTYTGRTIMQSGTLILESHTSGENTYYGALPPGTIPEIRSTARLDLNGLNQTLGGITDWTGLNRDQTPTAGEVLLGGGTLTINSATNTSFSGAISGPGAFIKTGSQTFTLAAGYTNAVDRTLRVAGGVLAVTGALSVEEGDFELAGGRITAGSLASEGAVWNVTLHAANEGQVLVDVDGNADITGATLILALADGYTPAYGKEYTLLYAGTLTGAEKDGDLFQYDDGDTFFDGDQEYLISWANGSEKIILTAIPEPGSLLLLLPAAAGLWLRRRARR